MSHISEPGASSCGKSQGETGEVLVLILFDATLTKSFCNTMVKEKNIIRNYGNGQMVGFSEEIKVIEGDWPQKYTIGLLRFDTMKDAKKWNFSDPLTKQQDWLDQVEIYVMPLLKAFPKKEYQVMELFNCDLINEEQFYHKFLPSYKSAIDGNGCQNFIACTDKVERWRGRHNFCHVMISLWPSLDDYMNWRNSEDFNHIRNLQDEICVGETIIVELKTKL